MKKLGLALVLAARPVYVLEPTAATPSGPGHPMHTVVPQWTRPAVLCAVGRAPELHGNRWFCPTELRQ